jgi:hypothetical protein
MFKIFKIVINSSENLKRYLRILLSIIEYMIFYILLLGTILLSMAAMGNFLYGDVSY